MTFYTIFGLADYIEHPDFNETAGIKVFLNTPTAFPSKSAEYVWWQDL